MKKNLIILIVMLFGSLGVCNGAQQTILGGPGFYWGNEKGKINDNFNDTYAAANAVVYDTQPGYTTLAQYDAAAVAAGKTLIISRTWSTVPATISASVYLTSSGMINNSSAVTFAGAFSADFSQHFIGDGTVILPTVGRILPEWWHHNISGTTDMLPAIQNAIAGNPTKEILLGAQEYVLSAPLVITTPNTIGGINPDVTVISRTHDLGDTIKWTGNDTTGTLLSGGIGLHDLTINAKGLMTNGWMIDLNGVIYGRIGNIRLFNGFGGIAFLGSSQVHIDRYEHFNNNLYGGTATGRSLLYFGDAPATYAKPRSGGIFITNLQLRGQNTSALFDHGVKMIDGDGLWITNAHLQGSGIANLDLNNSSSFSNSPLALNHFVNLMSDSCFGVGVLFEGDGGTGGNVAYQNEFVNLDVKGGGLGVKGIVALAGAKFATTTFSSVQVNEFLQTGVEINSTDFINSSWGNLQATANSLAGSGMYPSVRWAAGTGHATFTGGRSGGYNSAAQAGLTSYGMDIDPAAVDIAVTGMDLTRNVSGAFSSTGGTTSKTANNIIDDTAYIVASGSTIGLNIGWNYFDITGTTAINTISVAYIGRTVKLRFVNGTTLNVSGNIATTTGLAVVVAAGAVMEAVYGTDSKWHVR